MALVSGPGRAAGSQSDEQLHVLKHVDYVKNLDTVRDSYLVIASCSFCNGQKKKKEKWLRQIVDG